MPENDGGDGGEDNECPKSEQEGDLAAGNEGVFDQVRRRPAAGRLVGEGAHPELVLAFPHSRNHGGSVALSIEEKGLRIGWGVLDLKT